MKNFNDSIKWYSDFLIKKFNLTEEEAKNVLADTLSHDWFKERIINDACAVAEEMVSKRAQDNRTH